MKIIQKLLFTTMLISSIAQSTAIFAAETAKINAPAANVAIKNGKSTEINQQQYKELVVQSSKMMGHIGIANIALLHDMTAEARTNVKAALDIARKLETETEKLNAESMKLGKLKFANGQGKHDFWLPVLNDAFAVETIDTAGYANSKKPAIEIADAQLVHRRAMLDTKAIREQLEIANNYIEAKKYNDAKIALTKASESSFFEEVVSQLPLETVRDNLILARELSKHKNYSSASFAISHAEDVLAQYKKGASKADSAEISELQTEIKATKADLAKNDPSLLKTVETKIGKWIHEVEELGHNKKS